MNTRSSIAPGRSCTSTELETVGMASEGAGERGTTDMCKPENSLTPSSLTDDKRTLSERLRIAQPLVLMILVVSFLAVSTASAATAPKPWQWTAAQTARVVVAKNLTFTNVRGTVTAKCAGRGTATAGRFSSFRCAGQVVTYSKNVADPRFVVWVKIRPSGTGAVCASPKSFAAISKTCLRVTVVPRPEGSVGEAEGAVRAAATERFYPGQGKPIWQSFTQLDCSGSSGVYLCSFTSGFSGTATVTWTAAGPVVKFTSISCSDKLREINAAACQLP